MIETYLVGGWALPSEKWWSESQLGWWHSQHMESRQIPWFQTTNQFGVWENIDENRVPHCIHSLIIIFLDRAMAINCRCISGSLPISRRIQPPWFVWWHVRAVRGPRQSRFLGYPMLQAATLGKPSRTKATNNDKLRKLQERNKTCMVLGVQPITRIDHACNPTGGGKSTNKAPTK